MEIPDQNGTGVELTVVTAEGLAEQLLILFASFIEDYRSYLESFVSPEEIQALELVALAFFTTVWTATQHPTVASLSADISDTILNTLGKRVDEYLIERHEFDEARIKELQAIVNERYVEYDPVASLAMQAWDDETLDTVALWNKCGNVMFNRLIGRAMTIEDDDGAAFYHKFAARYYAVGLTLSKYVLE